MVHLIATLHYIRHIKTKFGTCLNRELEASVAKAVTYMYIDHTPNIQVWFRRNRVVSTRLHAVCNYMKELSYRLCFTCRILGM